MVETVGRVRREMVEDTTVVKVDTVKVPGFGFLDRELWAGLEPLRRVSFLCFPKFNLASDFKI